MINLRICSINKKPGRMVSSLINKFATYPYFSTLAKNPPSSAALNIQNNNNSNNNNNNNNNNKELIINNLNGHCNVNRILMSNLFIPLLKECPSTIQSISHQLLIRS